MFEFEIFFYFQSHSLLEVLSASAARQGYCRRGIATHKKYAAGVVECYAALDGLRAFEVLIHERGFLDVVRQVFSNLP